MCITSTARRRSLTLQVLPSHLLATGSVGAAASKPEASTTAVVAGGAPETRSTSYWPASPTKHPILPTKLNKKPSSHAKKAAPSSTQQIPHHDGLVVQHHYHDHAKDPVVDPSLIKHKAKGGVITPFPVKLHDMLDRIEADGLAHVVSWQPHGRCFVVHKPKEFVNHVMPHYFKQTKMASFQRQLNLYGFNRLTGGLDKGGYYHEMFLRGKVSLAYDIHRMRVKGTGVRLPTNPDNEPNFYALPPISKMDTMVASPSMTAAAVAPPPVPPLPAPKDSAEVDTPVFNMDQRRAELLRESHDHTMKIAEAKSRQQHKAESDVVFFEGLPFHYLDPSALPSNKTSSAAKAPAAASMPSRPKLAHSSSTVVSESDSDDNDSNNDDNRNTTFLPSFSPSNMDWDGPLSSPTLQAHMRRSSFQSFVPGVSKDHTFIDSRPLEEDIESFFQGFDMPVDMYHEQIERMGDDDDTAFGYLLEQAITE